MPMQKKVLSLTSRLRSQSQAKITRRRIERKTSTEIVNPTTLRSNIIKPIKNFPVTLVQIKWHSLVVRSAKARQTRLPRITRILREMVKRITSQQNLSMTRLENFTYQTLRWAVRSEKKSLKRCAKRNLKRRLTKPRNLNILQIKWSHRFTAPRVWNWNPQVLIEVKARRPNQKRSANRWSSTSIIQRQLTSRAISFMILKRWKKRRRYWWKSRTCLNIITLNATYLLISRVNSHRYYMWKCILTGQDWFCIATRMRLKSCLEINKSLLLMSTWNSHFWRMNKMPLTL